MEQKAQGAIEYLLIIGAAILVVAIVIIAVTSVLQQGQTQGTQGANDQNVQNQKLQCMSDANALGGSGTTYNCCTTFPKINAKCP